MNIFPNLDLNLKILLLSYLQLLSSNYLVLEYSCKFNEALILGPIFLRIDFRYKILKINIKLVLNASKLTGVDISK